MTHDDDQKPPTWVDDVTRYDNPVAEESEPQAQSEQASGPLDSLHEEEMTMSPTPTTQLTERYVRLLLRHARIQTTVLVLGLLWLLVAMTGSFLFDNSGIGKDIERGCSVSGLGEAMCTFTNRGWTPGATCIDVGVRVKASGELRGVKTVCSGTLAPRDSKNIQTSVLEGFERPTDWCKGGWGDSGGSWGDYCDISVVDVTE